MDDLVEKKRIDEPIQIVPYDPTWPKQYEQEVKLLAGVFTSDRLRALEHFGSTSVPGMRAKPVLDILVGLDSCSLTSQEKEALQRLGYEYIGKVVLKDRIYLRKRGMRNANLAIVKHGDQLWSDNLAVRDYLRAHSDIVRAYSSVKQEAMEQGISTLLAYADFKYDFVSDLLVKARAWKADK